MFIKFVIEGTEMKSQRTNISSLSIIDSETLFINMKKKVAAII